MKHLLQLLALSLFSCRAMEVPLRAFVKKDSKSDSLKNLVAFGQAQNKQNNLEASAVHYMVGSPKFQKILHALCIDALEDTDTSNRPLCTQLCHNVVNSADVDGQTPLHWAGALMHFGNWQQLLAYGADITLQDKQGCTPLYTLDSVLEDWHLDAVKTEHFMAFITAPMGGNLTIGQDITLSEARIFTFLCTMNRYIPPLDVDVFREMQNYIVQELRADVNLCPWGFAHKKESLAQLIDTVPYTVLSRLCRNDFIDYNKLLDALIDRHLMHIQTVIEKENEAGNNLFAHRLATIPLQHLKNACRLSYSKSLAETI